MRGLLHSIIIVVILLSMPKSFIVRKISPVSRRQRLVLIDARLERKPAWDGLTVDSKLTCRSTRSPNKTE